MIRSTEGHGVQTYVRVQHSTVVKAVWVSMSIVVPVRQLASSESLSANLVPTMTPLSNTETGYFFETFSQFNGGFKASTRRSSL